MRAYEEIFELIDAGSCRDRSCHLHPSDATKRRVVNLLHRQQTSGLSVEEAVELGYYVQFEHLKRLARALALYRLGDERLHQDGVQ